MDDGRGQVHALLPVLPQDPGQGPEHRLWAQSGRKHSHQHRHKDIRAQREQELVSSRSSEPNIRVRKFRLSTVWCWFREKLGNVMRSAAPGDFELWAIVSTETCVPGFLSSFSAWPRGLWVRLLSSPDPLMQQDRGIVLTCRHDRYKWGSAVHWQPRRMTAPCCCWRNSGRCHGKKQKWSRVLFSLGVRKRQRGRVDERQPPSKRWAEV